MIEALWPEARLRPTAPPSPALFAIGLRDPVTLAQIARLRDAYRIDWRAAPDGLVAAPVMVRAPVGMIQMTPSSSAAASDLARAAQQLAQGVITQLAASPVRTFLASGGETAQAVLSALGIERIDLCGVLLPGVALDWISANGGQPLHLVTRSGGFGDTQTLESLADLIVGRAGDHGDCRPVPGNRNRL